MRYRRYLLPLLIVVISASPGHALTISVAKIDKGAVQVKGKKAAPLALLTWEGQPVAQATNSGRFRFATTVLPNDCVGDLSDGTQTIPVAIQLCGPPGPQGPPGPAGLCQPQACATPAPGETPASSAVNIRFDLTATRGIQAFQIRAAYSTASGNFTGTAENVNCTVTAGGGGIFTANDNDSGALTISIGNTGNLTFPVAIECAFDATAAIVESDITVTVQEVIQNNGPGDVHSLVVSVSIL